MQSIQGVLETLLDISGTLAERHYIKFMYFKGNIKSARVLVQHYSYKVNSTKVLVAFKNVNDTFTDFR